MRWNRRARQRALAGLSGIGVGALVVTFGPGVAAHAAPTCVPAGPSGLTAAMVVTTGQTVTSQTVDGTGCDIGIYLAPGTNNVTLDTVTVSGANVHGIYGQDNDKVTIQNSTVQGNGIKPNPNINEQKAVELDGVTNSTIKNNTVQNNVADGGIGIDDDGPNSAGALKSGSSSPVKAVNDTVSGNTLPSNYGGCDIVVAAYNSGAGIDHVTVSGNTIPGKVGQFTQNGPFIGQIVVANDFPGNAITNVTVSNNTIKGSALAGIVLHANAPGDSETGTVISGNTLSDNHWLTPFGPPQTTGIAIQAEGGPPGSVPVIDNTLISGNTISSEYYDVWSKGQVTHLGVAPDNAFSGFVQEIFHKPDPGSGYTLSGADGGAYAFGSALYAGSAATAHPAAPIVGLAPSRDDGGYWQAAADGGVFSSGDAGYLGSLPALGVRPKAPIVGIAATIPGGNHGGPGPNGNGFYLVGADGGVFTFGDANMFGSLGNLRLNAPIVGMAVTPDDGGYWLVASDGGVFTFGDAAFFGSFGGKHLNAPIVGMIASPSGQGYTLAASDGGVFTFGDAKFYGSAVGAHSTPLVGISQAPGGYSLVSTDGSVCSYGYAGSYGSAPSHLGGPIVSITYTV